jgi:hypothetical protein
VKVVRVVQGDDGGVTTSCGSLVWAAAWSGLGFVGATAVRSSSDTSACRKFLGEGTVGGRW